MSSLHLCLCSPNECGCFIQLFFLNNVDHLAMLCTKPKSIRLSLAPVTMPQARVPKFRKSQNQYLVCPPFSLAVAVHPCRIERTHCWVVMSVRRIFCCQDHLHKSATWKWRHKTPITTVHSYMQTSPGWLISLDASGIKQFAEVSYCLRRFFPTVRRPAACQNHINVIFADDLIWFFGN